MNFCEIEGGGGSSKFGRCDAADLRAVRLWDPPAGSIVEAIEGCCCTAAAARLNSLRLVCPGGLNTSDSVVGGVGRVCDGGKGREEADAVAPGQN